MVVDDNRGQRLPGRECTAAAVPAWPQGKACNEREEWRKHSSWRKRHQSSATWLGAHSRRRVDAAVIMYTGPRMILCLSEAIWDKESMLTRKALRDQALHRETVAATG
jgi:hypothetical protein